MTPRPEAGPAFDVPISEVLDLLGETGRLDLATNPYLAEAVTEMTLVSPHSRRLVENQYRTLGAMFEPEALGYQAEPCTGGSGPVERHPGIGHHTYAELPRYT